MNRRDLLKTSGSLALGPLLLPHQGLAQSAAPLPLPPAGADGWVSLFNDRDLTGWYTMLQKSGKGAAEAKKIVTVESEMIHIMGNQVDEEMFEPGYIATNQEFENVHIRAEYKWGVKRFSPRSIAKRDNGILYGLVGEDKVWPRMVEYQIEEGDVGDFFLVDGIRGIQASHGAGYFGAGVSPVTGFPKETSAQAQAAAARRKNAPPREPTTGRMIKDGDFENRDGWNTAEIIWQGDRAIHILNGTANNGVTNLEQPDPNNPGKFIPLTRGKIAIEIEFAEIWFRRFEVRSLA